MSNFFAVFGYCLQGNGRVASVTRPEGGIGLPGGKLEEGETEIEALRRECEEEGWLIKIEDNVKPFYVRSTEHGLIGYYKVESVLRLLNYKEKHRIKNLYCKFWEIAKSGNGNGPATKAYFKKLIKRKLYKNWTFHNLISHPLSQITFLVLEQIKGRKYADEVAERIHDWSIPDF